MGCKGSKPETQHNGNLFNEDTNIWKRFLTGLQVSKGAEGIEGNFQIAFATTKTKRYEGPPPSTEEGQVTLEST